MFHFPGFASYTYVFSIRYLSFTLDRLPYSETHGFTLADSSPWIFAACHVLLRNLMPRHPPYALSNLTLKLFLLFSKNIKNFIQNIKLKSRSLSSLERR